MDRTRSDPERQESLVPLSPPTEETRWRCALCGNLTRFDVQRTVRSRDFVHVDLAGVPVVEEREVVSETIERVTCRWCGRADSVELVARPASELPTDQVPAVPPAAAPAVPVGEPFPSPVVPPAGPVGEPFPGPVVPPAGPVGEPFPGPVVPPAGPPAGPVAGVVPVAGPPAGPVARVVPAGPVAGVVPVAGPAGAGPAPGPALDPVQPEPVDGDPVADAIAAAEPVAPPP
jgi:hypothetical protein